MLKLPKVKSRRDLSPPKAESSDALHSGARAPTSASSVGTPRAEQVVRQYFDAYTSGRLDDAADCVANDCYYDDTVFPQPLRSREDVRQHLYKVVANAPEGLRFVIDDIVADEYKAGVTWHVELGPLQVPNGRGLSFYSVNDDSLIVFGRDVTEPPIRGGRATLAVLRGVTWLLRASGQAGEALKPNTTRPAMWLAYAVYIYYVLISRSLPGPPAFETDPESLKEVVNFSWDFFFVSPALAKIFGSTLTPAPYVHPAKLGLFNFVCAWSALLGGLVASDGRARAAKVPRFAFFIGIMFLTNIFMIPYMAWRAIPTQARAEAPERGSGRWIGALGSVIGIISIVWAVIAFPEQAGSVADRAEVLKHDLLTSRIDFAFGALASRSCSSKICSFGAYVLEYNHRNLICAKMSTNMFPAQCAICCCTACSKHG